MLASVFTGFICWVNSMMANAAVVNVLQATMSVEGSLMWEFTLQELGRYFSHTMVFNPTLSLFACFLYN